MTPEPDGTVTLPEGVSLEQVAVVGRDLVIQLPNGEQIIIEDGAVYVPQLVIGGVEIPAVNLAALLIGNEPQPAAGGPQSSGGNFAVAVGDIGPGIGIGNLLPPTALEFSPPEFEEVYPAIDEDEPTVIIITPDNPVGAEDVVQSTSDAGLPGGSQEESNIEETTGRIEFHAGDTPSHVTINGQDVFVGQIIESEHGYLEILAVNNGSSPNGFVEYRFVQTEAVSHAPGTNDAFEEIFEVVVTDADGDTATGSLTINIMDDVPDAADDNAGTLPEDSGPVVIDVFANDFEGADGVDLQTGVELATGPSKGTVVYNGDGTFTYTPNEGAEGPDSFTYEITDEDGDVSTATVTLDLAPDSTPTIEVGEPQFVDEEALATGSNPGSTAESTSGDFNITTGGDTVGSLVIDGVDVTNGGQVIGEYGTLVVTGNPTDGYSWVYTLSDNTTDHSDEGSTGTSEGIFDDFEVVVTDSDGDEASDTLVIEVRDDGPSAVNDSTATAEDTPVTYNVLDNDTSGADEPATLTAAALAPAYAGAGTVSFDANGEVTFTPNAGFEGQVVINYTMVDADGDPAQATLTITVRPDSTPTIEVGEGQFVDEEALPTGTNPGSTAESTSGDFNITTGGDTVGSLVIDGVDVTNGGQVIGEYGTLVVTGNPTDGYSWVYTLSDNTTDHPTEGSTGTSEGIFDDFEVVVTDSDGDDASDTLVIEVRDDGPVAVNDVTSTTEDTAVTYNVLDNDTSGADEPATLTAASLAPAYAGAGEVSFDANGEVTFTPAAGFEGEVVINYTMVDADGDPAQATLTITVGPDSTPTIEVGEGQFVDEEALATGSNPTSNAEQTSGDFNITTGGDTVGSLVIDGVDVTNGGQVIGEYGTLVVTGNPTDGYSWVYTLSDNTTDHPTEGSTGTSEGIFDDFEVVVTDSDGDDASDTLVIEVRDDGPTAVNDVAITDEGAPVTYNVLDNDTSGADEPATLTAASLADGYAQAGTVDFNANGEVTFTPAAGFEGQVVINYTMVDADGDPAQATLTITVAPDSTPTIEVGEGQFVDEEALATGSNPTSNAESTSGDFNITTGGDTVGSLVIDGVDVTNGGQVIGEYGTLVVTGNPTDGYSWVYTLSDNTLDHLDDTSTGTSEGVFDDFEVTVTDSDGDPASDTLLIEVRDDGPSAVNDTTTTAEDTAVTYNVVTNSDGTSDTSGADEPATLVAAVLAPAYAGAGTVSFDANGEITFTPNAGFEGPVVINYTIEDADGDPAQATLTITVAPDSEPTIEVGEGKFVDEEALATGSNPGSTAESTSGDFNITTGGDDIGSLVIDGVDVTNGGQVIGEYGVLTVTGNPTDGYSWVYTLSDNTTDHPDDTSTGTSEGIVDDFNVVVTDSDGDSADDTLVIEVRDDGPVAVNDTTTTAEDTAVTYNVVTNSDGTSDTSGADEPATLVAAVLAPAYAGAGTVGFNANGEVTFTPNAGFEGPVVINYTIEDADGDQAQATLTITVGPDSTPTISVEDGKFVDEEALATGSNPGSTAESTSGDFNITTGGDDIGSLVIDGVDVTNGGQVIGEYGTLVVTGNPTDGYSWVYTLSDNTLDHLDDTSTGTSEGVFDDFEVTVTDSDGDPASDTLVIEVRDDGPSAVNDTTTTAEDTAVTYNVVTNSDGTSDTSGADEPATLVAAVLAPAYAGAGTVSFDANGEVTFTPNAGFEGPVVINYTIEDADGDQAQATLTITVGPDSTPTISVEDGKFVDEEALATGSNPTSTAESTSGDFNITTGGDDIGSLVIDGVDVTNGGQVIGEYGTLVVTGNPTDGYSWVYTLSDNTTDHPDDTSTGTSEGIVDDFNVVVTDSDGDSADDTLVIEVRDDGPTARADVDSVKEDTQNTADGNVLTGSGGVDANATDGVSDIAGADGPATVVGVAAGNLASAAGNVGVAVAGAYGSITIGANGQYQYVLDPTKPAVNALDTNETLTDTFTYTIEDGDGDPSTTTITITINGTNDAPVVGTGSATVSEEGLATGNPDNTGSPDTTNSASDLDGQLSITDVDDSSFTVTLGLPTAELTSNGVDIEWSLLDSQTLVGKAGATEVIRVTIDNAGNYDVVLKGQIDHPDGTVEDQVMFDVPVAVSDGEATTNSSISVITVEDDAPVAFTPGSTPVSGTLTNVPGSTATYNLDTDGDINNNMGADQGGTITFNVVDGQDSPYTSGGDLIEYFVSDDGQTLEGRTGGENGDLIFTIELDQDNGTYTVTMVDTIDNGSGVEFADLSGGEAGNPPFKIVASTTEDALELLFTPIGTNTINSDSDDIAAGGQFLVFDDGLRIDFGDFTFHPNGGGTSNDGFTINEHTPVNGFRFTVDQISNGTVADIKLVTYDADVGSPNQTIGAHNFTNDTPLLITKVEVYDTAGVLVATFTGSGTQAGITATFDGVNGVILRGVPTQYSIETTAASLYDRIEITNVGTGGQDGKFSISELQIEQVDFGDPVDVTIPVTLTDADGDSVDADLDFTIGTAAPPIALDLDGDGLEFVSQQAGNVFDYNGDGHAEATAWVSSDDGVLAIDNGSGEYDVTFAVAGSTDLQGLAQTYDSNGDGKLSAADAEFAKFGVLQDGEFKSLAEAGIESLDLVSDGIAYSAANGQVQVFGEATFTRTDGSTGALADAAFAYSSARTSEAAQRVFGEHAGGAYANLLAAASMITAAATGFAAAQAPLLKAIGVQEFLGDVSEQQEATFTTQIETVRPEMVDAFDGGAKEGPLAHDTVRFSQDHSNLLESAGFEAPQADQVLSHLLANTELAPSLHDAAPMLVDMNVMPTIAPLQAMAQNEPVAAELVAEVLADALSGGAQAGLSIDDMLAALPATEGGATIGVSQEFGAGAMVLALNPMAFHHEASLVLHQDSVPVA